MRKFEPGTNPRSQKKASKVNLKKTKKGWKAKAVVLETLNKRETNPVDMTDEIKVQILENNPSLPSDYKGTHKCVDMIKSERE